LPVSIRNLTVTVAASAAAVFSLTAGPAAFAAGPAASNATDPVAAGAGLTGTPITLANNAEFSGYDAATDASGKAYIGWIADTGAGRKVSLCTLPRGAKSCAGGIQTVDSLGDSSAQDLRVLVTPGGEVTLVWFHDTPASENGPQGSEIAIASSQSGGPLSAPHDVATAPSFGSMFDAVAGPGGTIWTVTQSSGVTSKLQIRPGFTNPPVTITAPYVVGAARLRFSGSTAVLAIQKDSFITQPVSYAFRTSGPWSSFHAVAHTWTSDSDLGLASTPSGVRLLASVANADYFPVVSRWTGSGFSAPALTGDRNNCSPSSHDPVSDASGRMADVSIECSDLAIANLTDTLHAAVARVNVHGTFANGDPQLTTAPSGRGWVAWSIESTHGNKLLVAPLVLPGRLVTATKSAGGNRVTLTGPASCLPPVDLGIGVKGSPAAHWSAGSKVLKLGATTLHSPVVHGGSMKPGTSYTLTGSVTFSHGGSRQTVTATLKFRTCPSP
jgi:hypothetical protein